MPILYTATLSQADVGRVPRDGRPGVFGTTNWGMISYTSGPGDGGKPAEEDVVSLAELYGVDRTTVERWFGIALFTADGQQTGVVSYRNCVPQRQITKHQRALGPSTIGARPCNVTFDTLERILLAAPLVAGGLSREPLFSLSADRKGRAYGVADSSPADTLGDAVELVQGVLEGSIGPSGDLAYNACSWTLIEIKYEGEWVVNVTRSFPRADEYDRRFTLLENECPG